MLRWAGVFLAVGLGWICTDVASTALWAQTDGTGDLEREVEFQKGELERLRKELDRDRQDVRQLKGREQRIGGQIESVEKEIARTERYLRALRKEEQDLKARMQRADTSLEAARDRLSEREQIFARRLREMYRRGRPTELEMLMSSRSLPDLMTRRRYAKLVAHQDRREYERIRQEKAGIERDRHVLDMGYREKVQVEQEKKRERRNLDASKQEKARLLSTVQQDRRLREEHVQEQQLALKKLESLIEELIEKIARRREPDEPLGEALAARKGALPWPLKGRVVTRFGKHRDRVLRTVTFNRGVDIAVAEGTEVHAVAGGTVALTEWIRGYGKVLLMHHGGGYFTLCGHLSEILVVQGDRVLEGDVVAISGETGSLDGPKLHFEVLMGKEAQDPLKWLKEAGEE